MCIEEFEAHHDGQMYHRPEGTGEETMSEFPISPHPQIRTKCGADVDLSSATYDFIYSKLLRSVEVVSTHSRVGIDYP